jgi:hypothetical protein
MPNTYKAISTITVGSGGQSALEFTNIPNTYTDLQIKLSGRDNYSSTRGSVNLTFNSTTSGYRWMLLRFIDAASSPTTDDADSASWIDAGRSVSANATSNMFNGTDIYIFNYLSSEYKRVLHYSITPNDSSTVHFLSNGTGLWKNTAAITSIKIEPQPSQNWVQYTTATLYGIKNS